MYQLAQRACALVEIARDAHGRIPVSLIAAAYNASKSAPVILVLDSISAAEVDAILDPMVAGSFREYQGVIYVDAGEAEELPVHPDAPIFAHSAALRNRLNARGISYQDIARAEPTLLGS
ncbi:MAG TPA: hypothetical protein VEB19_02355 [Gemmatimonadaceae bacterium]|nr:hypothetical protein [Gemmatimonadaceae bacterium]